MKNIFPKIIFLFFISSIFCNENEKYSFISQIPEINKTYKLHTDRTLSFTIPSVGYIQFVSSYNEIGKYLRMEDELHVVESTLTEMETDNSIANIEIMDYYWQAMNNVSCYVYINNDGRIKHIKPVKKDDNYLQEAFEGAYLGMFERSYKYPFSKQAIDKKVGESWTTASDSSKFHFTMNSPPSFAWIKTTFQLKKVRKTRGRNIAYIDVIDSLDIDVAIKLKFMNEERFIKGRAIGTAEGAFKWDIDANRVISFRLVSNLEGDFEMDNEKFLTKFKRSEKHKALD